jgi:hypothetical protein
VANLVADTLSRIHHPVSTTPAATISINTMAFQSIGVLEWKHEVCELLVEDAYLGPIVNVLRQEADVTEDGSQLSKKNIIGKTWCEQDCSDWTAPFVFRRDTGAL